jgi:hypothetical protein
MMIGWVEFTEGGATREAILGSDGLWTCDGAPHVAELLNRECSPGDDSAEDSRGYVTLIEAAQRLHRLAWPT